MHLPLRPADTAAVYLDYGADATQFRDGDLRVTTRGLELKSRWQFDLGAELGVNVQLGDPPHTRLVPLRGIVVGCHRDAHCPEETPYLLTLIFLEPPDKLAEAVDLITRALARRSEMNGRGEA